MFLLKFQTQTTNYLSFYCAETFCRLYLILNTRTEVVCNGFKVCEICVWRSSLLQSKTIDDIIGFAGRELDGVPLFVACH